MLTWLTTATAVITLAACTITSSESALTAPKAQNTVSYAPSDEIIANPERGIYRHQTSDCGTQLFDPTTLKNYRQNDKTTLVMCLFYLKEFKNLDTISTAKIQKFYDQARLVRSAGLKMIVRFAYTDDPNVETEAGKDAPVERVLKHIDQLAPALRGNHDVIDLVQSGFVGAWGEGYFTKYFGNAGNVSPTDWDNRKRVASKLLSVLPVTRFIQVRTIQMKRMFYGGPVTGDTAYTGSDLSRTGHHNDCFMRDSTDSGTYLGSTDRTYLADDTRFVAMGGETCAPNPNVPSRVSCTTALSELAQFHWSFLNKDWHPGELTKLSNCMPEIQKRLGYRLSLVSSTFPTSVKRGTSMNAGIMIRNTGFSHPHNRRPVVLVLRNTTTGALYKTALGSADPRRWSAGQNVQITQPVGVPSTLATGTYDVLLSLPDLTPGLGSRPEYAVQMANVGVWEQTTGFNRLTSIQITG